MHARVQKSIKREKEREREMEKEEREVSGWPRGYQPNLARHETANLTHSHIPSSGNALVPFVLVKRDAGTRCSAGFLFFFPFFTRHRTRFPFWQPPSYKLPAFLPFREKFPQGWEGKRKERGKKRKKKKNKIREKVFGYEERRSRAMSCVRGHELLRRARLEA